MHRRLRVERDVSGLFERLLDLLFIQWDPLRVRDGHDLIEQLSRLLGFFFHDLTDTLVVVGGDRRERADEEVFFPSFIDDAIARLCFQTRFVEKVCQSDDGVVFASSVTDHHIEKRSSLAHDTRLLELGKDVDAAVERMGVGIQGGQGEVVIDTVE